VSPVLDKVVSRYLGYAIEISDRDLKILAPDGRKLYTGPCELSSARRFIRGHRRELEVRS
jgi:hypothetical protein